MIPDWVLGMVLIFREITALATMILFLITGGQTSDDFNQRPWQCLAALFGACGGLTFLVACPFQWPG